MIRTIPPKIVELSKGDNDPVPVQKQMVELFHEPGCPGRIMAIVVTNNYGQPGVGQKLMTSNSVFAVRHRSPKWPSALPKHVNLR